MLHKRVYLLCVLLLLVGSSWSGRTSGGSRSGGSRGSSGSSGSRGSYSSSSSRGSYSSSSGSSGRYGGGSSSGYGSGGSTGSRGYGGSGSSGSSGVNYGWTHPKPSHPVHPIHTQSQNPHTQSHFIPISTGARTPSKPLAPTHRPFSKPLAPTQRPFNTLQSRSTPKPVNHFTGGRNTSGSSNHFIGSHQTGGGSHHGTSGRNTTGGFHGGHSGGGKVEEHVQKSQVGGQNSGRNVTGGAFAPSAPILPSQTSGTHSPSAPPAPGFVNPSNPHNPSAPPSPGFVNPSNPHNPSAPPSPGFINPSNPPHSPSTPGFTPGVGAHQPPGPGWHPGVTHGDVNKQHVSGSQSGYPPPPVGQYPPGGHYPGPGGQYPSAGHYPAPGGQYPGGHPPPMYPSNAHYPNQPPPPYYPQGHYPGQGQHYPTQYGGPVNLPPPPPGYSPYGTPYYKDKSGIKASHVVAGLALWELMRSNHHHGGYGMGMGFQRSEVHHHHYHDGSTNTNSESSYYQPSYHDVMRERYTTRITPTSQNPTGPGAYNVLEMTHYITPDEKGEIYSTQGNMTCTSVYNARSVSNIHMKQVKDFEKQFPNSVFPLYRTENETYPDNFTIIPGRVIHKEPVSITCCGSTDLVDITLLTNGKHPNVNCVTHLGHIPIRKITFIKSTEVKYTGEWYPVDIVNPNTTSTETPLAPFPEGFFSTETPNHNLTNTTSTPLAPFPNVTHLDMVSPSPNVDMNQTFAPLGANVSGIDLNQTFTISTSTESVTNNPSDLVLG